MISKGFIVAIDGPAGAGKSTVAKMSAKKLRFEYLDTGAMYRAFAWFALKQEIDLEKSENLQSLISEFEIDLRPDPEGNNKIFFGDQDITEEVRRPVVSQAVSYVADDIDIRYYLVKKQRELARGKNCVLEGRDIGTHVFPDADIKFYLTASLEERSLRRNKDFKEKGYDFSYEELKKTLEERDYKDKAREVGALKRAEDAILVDSTEMSQEEVIDKIVNEVLAKYKVKMQGE